MDDQDHNVTIVDKGRRTGITWCVAVAKVLKAAKSKQGGGGNVLYVGTNKDLAREFVSLCAEWAKKLNQVLKGKIKEEIFDDETEKGVKAFRIDFASGFSIIGLCSAPRALRGRQGDIVIDEAAFHEDLEELMKSALAANVWSGKIIMISTHNGVDNPFNQIIEDVKLGRKPYKHINIPFMDAIDQGLYKRICQTQNIEWSKERENKFVERIYAEYGDDAAEELDTIPANSNGSYFSASDIAACMDKEISVLRIRLEDDFKTKPKQERISCIENWCQENLDAHLNNLNPNEPHTFGMDIARVNDLSVIWPLNELTNTAYFTPFVVEIRNMPYSSQQQILRYIIDKMPRFVAGSIDASGGGSETAERMAQEYGENLIHEVKFSEKIYNEIMPAYKRRLEDRSITIPQDRDIRDDHKMIQKINGTPKVIKQRKGMAGSKRHGDSVVACALAIHAMKNASKAPVEFTTAVKRERFLGY